MNGFLKKTEPIGQVATLLATLRKRAGLTQRKVALMINRSYQPVHLAESYPGGVSKEIVREIATACGATAEELDRLEVLCIIDARSLPLPKDVTEEQVRKMLVVLGEKTSTAQEDTIVTVCADCRRASCWHGIFFCDNAQTANIVDVPRSVLLAEKRENPSYLSDEHLKKVYG